jgi:hypothetical protein
MEKSLELVHKGNEIEVPQTWYDYAAFLWKTVTLTKNRTRVDRSDNKVNHILSNTEEIK